MLNKYSIVTLLACCTLFAACAGIKSYDTIDISTDRNIISILKDKSEKIKSVNASLGIVPAIITGPELSAYMSYNQEGQFKLTGLTSTGFTLFSFETTDDQYTLSLSDGRSITGDVKESDISFKEISGIDIPIEINMTKEVIDFYGSDSDHGTFFLIEDIRGYYILNQLEIDGVLSYPIRRWWINKKDMAISRKEIFSRHKDRIGERTYEVIYEDFRIVDNVPTPFAILVKDSKGDKLLRMKFYNVEYNRN